MNKKIYPIFASDIPRLLLLIIFLFPGLTSTLNSFAEGTKQLMPASTDNSYMQIYDNNDPNRNFMTYGCTPVHRLNIRICNVGEKIYIGLNQDLDKDVYFRLKDPAGNALAITGLTSVGANTYKVPTTGTGYISSYAKAVVGPTATGGATGYTAASFTTTAATGTGDYYIEFNPTDPVTVNVVKRMFTYFDITVANAAGNTA
ncbi:MAG: hypothetical protein ACJ75J_09345, partial [Cytophagaceae bacterium]